MGSRKQSARARERAEFEAQLGQGSRGLGDAFAGAAAQRERMVAERMVAEREGRLRYKACDRKKRYASRAEAESAIRDCKRHGSRDLHCYQCTYCGGWHLTHKSGR